MFDAIVQAPNGKHYFFARDIYWRFDRTKGAVDPGYPLKIEQNWPGVPHNMDAAFRGLGTNSDKIYFLKGRRYWRYDFSDGAIDPGYPAKIDGNLKGFWDNGLDAVVEARGDRQYLFRHNIVRHRNNSDGKIVQEAKPLSEIFAGVPGNLCAAVTGLGRNRDALHFFQRDLSVVPSIHQDARTETAVMEFSFGARARATAVRLDTLWPGFAAQLPADRDARIAAFAADTRTPKFPMLDRAKMAEQLRHRLKDPRAVRQINSAFCGPASIIYWLVKTQPDVYLKAVDELYHLGKFRTHGETIIPDPDFLQTSPNLATAGHEQIAEIDWMMMGALRSARGKLTDVEGDGEESGANGLAMKYWAREVLGLRNTDHNRSYALGEHKALDDADAAFNKGGVGFLNIHSGILKDEVKKKDKDEGRLANLGAKMFGNHWVVYEGDYWCDPGRVRNPRDGHFSFRVYTWGKIQHLSLSEEDFRDGMYGSVNAW